MKENKKIVSLVVPFFNEEASVEEFFSRVLVKLAPITSTYDVEFVCVNDGSRDNTLQELIRCQSHFSGVKILDLSRNFGKEAAITAGLDHAAGDAVVPIDADLQHPPETIIEMLRQWENGFEVVLARRIDRETDRKIQMLTAKAFYEVSRYITHIEIPADVGDFRLMDAKVVKAVKAMRESCRFMKGIFAWVGFRTTVVEYRVEPRQHGKSSFNTWKLWNFALEGITSFSTVPLRIWTYIGFLISFFAFLFGSYLIVKTIVFGADTPGYASMMLMILFFSGVQLIGVGVLGEYLGRVFLEVKKRPPYIIREIID